MAAGFFRRGNEIERQLRSARPHAPAELADRLVARVSAPVRTTRRLRGRLVLAGGLTALMAVALAATGGMSYAASTISHVVAQVTQKQTYMGSRMAAVQVKQNAASCDQYCTSTGTSSADTVGGGTTDLAKSLNTNTSGLVLGQNGSVFLEASTRTNSPDVTLVPVDTSTGTVLASISVPKSTFTALTDSGAQNIVVDPKPQVTTLGGAPVVGVTLEFQDANHNPIHVQNLATPIAVTIPKPAGGFPAGYKPAFSTDGTHFTAVDPVSGPNNTLGADQQTGYYVDTASGNIIILTRHTTLFAVIARTGFTISASGRKLAPANSGKFGDAALYSPNKAQLKQAGGAVKTYGFAHLSGSAVHFGFFVDQQVSAYVQLYKGGTELPIQLHGTMIRGSTLSKNASVKTLHIAVLTPGTLNLRLRTPSILKGAHYRIRVAVLNFDGTQTVSYIPFTG